MAGANLLSRSSIRLVYLVASEITCDNWWRHTRGTLSPCRAPGSRHRRGRGRQLRGTAHPPSSELCPAAGAASRNPDHVAGFPPLRGRQDSEPAGRGEGQGGRGASVRRPRHNPGRGDGGWSPWVVECARPGSGCPRRARPQHPLAEVWDRGGGQGRLQGVRPEPETGPSGSGRAGDGGLAWTPGDDLAPTGDAVRDEEESDVQGAEAAARGSSLPRQVLRCG